MAMNRPEMTPEQEIDEAVFMKSFIPRKLDDVLDAARDIDLLAQGNQDEVRHCVIT